MPDRCPLFFGTQGDVHVAPVSGDSGLELLDLSDFAEACLAKSQVEHVPASTEPGLLGFQDAAALEVLVLLLDREVHHGIDHVLKLVRTGHFTGLVDLVDDDANGTGFLAEVGDVLEASNGRTRRDLTRGVSTVIEAL